MNSKFSAEIQAEIDEIKNKVQAWKYLFDIEINLYIDGWAVSLREKNAYPRYITIFKSYESCTYSIKSFEVHLKNYKDEEFKELYKVENIKDQSTLLHELREIIYGKDLMNDASNMYKKTFLN